MRSGQESITPSNPPTPGSVVLLGLGNDILSDDAVGLRVAREVRRLVGDLPGIRVEETEEMGLALLDFVVGARVLVLVDSIQTGRRPPGEVHCFDGASLNQMPVVSPHFLGVGETMALARQLGLAVPEHVEVHAIEVSDPFTVSTEMTPAIRQALPEIVAGLARRLRELAGLATFAAIPPSE